MNAAMPDPTPKTVYLKDYTPSAFLIPTIALDVAIFEDYTRVRSRLAVRRNSAAGDAQAPVCCDKWVLQRLIVPNLFVAVGPGRA